jgi:hypothetical protein
MAHCEVVRQVNAMAIIVKERAFKRRKPGVWLDLLDTLYEITSRIWMEIRPMLWRWMVQKRCPLVIKEVPTINNTNTIHIIETDEKYFTPVSNIKYPNTAN